MNQKRKRIDGKPIPPPQDSPLKREFWIGLSLFVLLTNLGFAQETIVERTEGMHWVGTWASSAQEVEQKLTQVNYVDADLHEFIDDGSWCWFQDERAVVDTVKGKLIIGSANMQGGVDLIIFDLKTKKVESIKRFGGLTYSDDHNAPGMLIAPNGNYLALWNHHYDRHNTRYSVYDGKQWSSEKRFDWKMIPGGTNFTICYSNVYALTAENRLYNFARANNRSPNFIYSDDNGETWAWEAVTANSTVDNFRPIVPKWTEGKESLLWFRGTYRKAQDITVKVVGTFYEN